MNKKLKEGVSVQELENFGKKYRFQLFFILYFVLATLLTFLFFGAAWSILLAGVGGVLGIWFPKKIEGSAKCAFQFVFKQEKITKLILAIVGVVLSFFLPPLVFFAMGLMGGAGMHSAASNIAKTHDEGEGEGGQ